MTINRRKGITPHGALMALGYNADGTISRAWGGLNRTHRLYGTAAYKVAFEEWKSRSSWHFSPQRAMLAAIGTKLDRILAALEQSPEP